MAGVQRPARNLTQAEFLGSLSSVTVKILELRAEEVVVIVNARGLTTQPLEAWVRAQLSGSAGASGRPSEWPPVADPPTFRREGQHWRVSFAGAVASLDSTVGVCHIARLLAEPGRRFRCDELLALEAGESRPLPVGSAVAATDARSLREYKRRLKDLADEVDAARGAGDGEQVAILHQEMERLEAHLGAVLRKGGRPRHFVDTFERARQAVSAAIRRTMKVLKSAHPLLWRHLYKHLKTGSICEYSPDPPVTWVTA
jgi:hypothetical protein